MLSSWIDKITIKNLLDFAPHGFLSGCVETSEYLAYAFRVKPETEDELFRRFNRRGEYYNSAIDEIYYPINLIDEVINEIKHRLDKNEYVRISFTNYSDDSSTMDIFDYLKCPPTPKLFDHSFVLFKYNNKIWRIESYITQYTPRMITWDSYEVDMVNLIDHPLTEWKRIFDVECDSDYDLKNIEIILSS